MQYTINTNSLVPEEYIAQMTEQLKSYTSHLALVAKKRDYTDPECSLALSFDDEILKQAQGAAQNFKREKLTHIFVIGIGGSNLGTKAIYDGLYGAYDSLLPNRFPKIIFLDTQDETTLLHATQFVKTLKSKEEFVINAISKSGGTTETAVNLEVLSHALATKFGDISDRIIFTTDQDSKMYVAGQKNNIRTLTLPHLVGGRYSVFSNVGLLPLILAGIDIVKLRAGAQKSLNDNLFSESGNLALISAITLYYHWTKGVPMNDTFIFLPQLESLGKWYRQLMGESIGKEEKGITPTVSIGSTDLHSVGQLYLGGPKDKITTFIFETAPARTMKVPQESVYGLVDGLENLAVADVMGAIIQGTMKAYIKQGLPFMSIGFSGLSEHTIAEYMQFKMIEMMYLGKLMGVNTFDQPHVELYKNETRNILSELQKNAGK